MPTRRPTLLVAALAALATAAPAAPAGAAAKQAAKTCRPGQLAVRAAAKNKPARVVCRNASGARRPVAQLPGRARAELRTPAELRAALPARQRARLPLAKVKRLKRALDRATARRLASWTVPAAASGPLTGAAVARGAAATGPLAGAAAAASAPLARAAATGAAACDAAPTFQVDPIRSTQGSVTAVSSGGGWVAGSGSTAGRLVVVDADAGNGVRAVQTTKDCISWDPCPDANGFVHGAYEYTVREEYTATVRGSRVRTGSVVTVTAKLTARVGDDARVISYDWDADGRAEHTASATIDGKLTHVPTRTTRVHVRVRGVDPRDGGAPLKRPYGAARGNKGALTAEELPAAQAIYQLATELTRYSASKALLEAESNWYRGKCLTAELDPVEPEVTPGQRVDVAIRVRAADGREALVPLEIEPYDGAVGPPRGTAPMTTTWTAPQQLDSGVFAAFEVTSTSKRGRLEAVWTAKAARAVPWFRTTFSGDGSYSRHEMGSGLPQVDARHSFAWRSTAATRFPFFDGLRPGTPMLVNTDATELTGELRGWRTDGGGTRGCSAAPEQADQIGLVRQTQTADGGFDVAVTPFNSLVPPGGVQPECDTGAFLFWTKGTREAMTYAFHVSKADLESRDAIVLTAAPQNPLNPDCWGGEANGEWACEQSVGWTGTLRLDRIAPVPGWQP